MHREIGDQIEEILANRAPAGASQHLDECAECQDAVRSMQDHSRLLRELRPPADLDSDPRPGFYARVLERIEAEGPISIWNLFMESAFGRRIAVASFALALLMGVYLVSSERSATDPLVAEDGAPALAAPQAVEPVSLPVGQVVAGAPFDPFAIPSDQVVIEMNQFVTHMEPGSSDNDVLADLVTYREQ